MAQSTTWWPARRAEFIASFPTKTTEELCAQFGVSRYQLYLRAAEVSIQKDPAYLLAQRRKAGSSSANTKERVKADRKVPLWSEHEETLLRAHYLTATKEQLLHLLPRRTRKSIQRKAEELGLQPPKYPWLPAEDEFLKANYANTDNATLVKRLNALPEHSGPPRTVKGMNTRAVKVLKIYKSEAHRKAVASQNRAQATPPHAPIRIAQSKLDKRAPEKAAPVGKADKELEKTNGIAQQLRALPYNDPLRLKYQQATRPGTKPTDVPRTMAELKTWTPSPSTIR